MRMGEVSVKKECQRWRRLRIYKHIKPYTKNTFMHVSVCVCVRACMGFHSSYLQVVNPRNALSCWMVWLKLANY